MLVLTTGFAVDLNALLVKFFVGQTTLKVLDAFLLNKEINHIVKNLILFSVQMLCCSFTLNAPISATMT